MSDELNRTFIMKHHEAKGTISFNKETREFEINTTYIHTGYRKDDSYIDGVLKYQVYPVVVNAFVRSYNEAHPARKEGHVYEWFVEKTDCHTHKNKWGVVSLLRQKENE